MKKIAILGGSFDPFHLGHLAMAEKVIEEKVADKVLIVPTIVTYHKPFGHTSWLSPGDRLMVIGEMIKRSVCREHIEIDCSDYDALNRIRPECRPAFQSSRRFIHTLLEIKEKYPEDTEFLFILGTDQAEEFCHWFQYEDILKLAKPVVFNGRAGRVLELGRIFSPYEFVELRLDISKYGMVSSTRIRNDMEGRTASYYLDHVGEEVITKTPIFTLVRKAAPYADQPDFHPVGINSPDWVTVIARFKDGNGAYKYVTVRQLRYGPMKEFDEFPCGMVEKDEYPAAAAARELREETGWTVVPDKLVYLGAHSPNPAFMNNLMYYYFIDLDETNAYLGQTDRDEHERISIGEMSLKELDKSFRDNKGSALIGCALHLMKDMLKEEEK